MTQQKNEVGKGDLIAFLIGVGLLFIMVLFWIFL